MFRKLRDQGDGSSAAPGITEPAPEVSSPESPEAAPAKGDAGKEPTVAELQEMITGLKKTVGEQGNQIGEYKRSSALMKQESDTNRAFMEQLKKSPAETLKSLGLAAGLTVSAPSAEVKPTGDAAADQEAQINAIVQKALADNMGPVNNIIDTVQDSHLAAKYGESWDELAPVRATNEVRIRSNQIPMSELAHMVSEFGRFPEHLAAAKEEGREEFRKELEQKAGEHQPGSEGQQPHKIPENEQTPAHAAARLASNWPG